MICSSVNLLRFIRPSFHQGGLYFRLEEISRGRSALSAIHAIARHGLVPQLEEKPRR
jgi:hypothetical protein